MTNIYLKAATILALAASMHIATFAQSPTDGRWERPGSGAVRVFDRNRHLLGTLVGLTPTEPAPNEPLSFVLFRNGYFISMGFNGQFPVGFEFGSQIYWTGSNCTGDSYLSSQDGPSPAPVMSRRTVIWDGNAANSLYVASGHGEYAVAVETPVVSAEIANSTLPGTSECFDLPPAGPSHIVGWLLTPLDARKVLGWDLSGTPLRVQAPLQFKDR
jgi:hypothetical protein